MKILCIILVVSMVFGVGFSSTVKALTSTISVIDNSFTKVSDLFGINLFSGIEDVTPSPDSDYENMFNLGYYEHEGVTLPVWKYIDGIIENYAIRDVHTVREAIRNEADWHAGNISV